MTSGRWVRNASTRLDAVGRLGHDVQVGLLVDDVGDAGAQQRVVVHEQHLGGGDGGDRLSLRHRAFTGIENEGGSHASTTSVPARGAVTMVSDAPMRSARSCMLVMPNPRERMLAGDAAAVVGHRQPQADRPHRGRA